MKNRQSDYNAYRETYPSIVYSGYDISACASSLDVTYRFSVPGLADFAPTWSFGVTGAEKYVHDPRLRTLVFSLGMVELISYYKICCPETVKVECGALTDAQCAWWKKLMRGGLGEFFYTNGIEPGDFVTIESCGDAPEYAVPAAPVSGDRVLVPIGGGKDSAVTLELTREYAERIPYIINPRGATVDTVTAAGIPYESAIIAKRTLDKNMLDLNAKGFLNGHTPFSSLVAFSSVIAAYVSGIGYVALSNESSANEPTVIGSDVNHQYSKSLEFESDFIEYEKEHVGSGVSYFSLLRPLSELGIAALFSRFPAYHGIFRSCNAGSKQNVWCARCPKCLFVYIILSPFLTRAETVSIFGRDMLDDPDMIPLLDSLCGVTPVKPFECVGRVEEVNAAMQELDRQVTLSGESMPALLAHYRECGITEKYDIRAICLGYDEENRVPEKFVPAVKRALEEAKTI